MAANIPGWWFEGVHFQTHLGYLGTMTPDFSLGVVVGFPGNSRQSGNRYIQDGQTYRLTALHISSFRDLDGFTYQIVEKMGWMRPAVKCGEV